MTKRQAKKIVKESATIMVGSNAVVSMFLNARYRSTCIYRALRRLGVDATVPGLLCSPYTQHFFMQLRGKKW